MKGRSPYNKPEIRRKELLYYLLDKEKVRWKTVKDDFRKRKWGPTTVKQYLNMLCEEGLVHVEAVHGPEGPEVWYCVNIGKVAENIFRLQKRGVEIKVEKYTLEELKEVSSRLRIHVFQVMLNLFWAQFINYFYLTALTKYRNRDVKNIDYLLRMSSEYFWDISFKKGFMKLLDFALAFPEDTQIAIAEMLGRDELKAWVEKRELQVLIEAKEVAREADAILLRLIPEMLNVLKELYEKAKSKDEMLVFKKGICAFENMLKKLEKRQNL